MTIHLFTYVLFIMSRCTPFNNEKKKKKKKKRVVLDHPIRLLASSLPSPYVFSFHT